MNKKHFQHSIQFNNYPKQEKLSDFPTVLGVEITASCNLACPMCTETWRRNTPAGRMTPRLYEKIVTEATQYPDFCTINFMGRGDPSLHPSLVDFVQLGTDKGINTFITTHGNFDRSLIDELLQSGITHFRISLDAFTPSVYKIVRKGGNFFKAYENTLYLCQFKERISVAVSFVKQEANQNETEQFKNFWEPKGIKAIITNRVSLSSKEPPHLLLCPSPWRRLAINYEGDVFSCYQAAYNDVDEQKNFTLGNANTDSIHSLWHAKQMQDLRNMHSTPQQLQIPMCMNCNCRCSKRWN